MSFRKAGVLAKALSVTSFRYSGLKALAAPHPTSSDPPLSSGPPFDSSSIPFTVPWTITNRYYTADVHFSAWTVDKLFAELFERQPPTVVFVWFDGEVSLSGHHDETPLLKCECVPALCKPHS